MSGRLQSGPQLVEVVNLAIKDNLDGAIFIAHWLASRLGKVDNRQPPMPQRESRPLAQTKSIRPARHHGVAHRDDALSVDRPTIGTKDAANSTHGQSIFLAD